MRPLRLGQRLGGHTTVDADVAVGASVAVDGTLAAECEAFLAGRRADCRNTEGRPLPRWAWLNQAAHADIDSLRHTAAQQVDTASLRGDDIQAVLARAVVAASGSNDVVRLQREVLVPLELRMMGSVMSPRRAVELVTAALF